MTGAGTQSIQEVATPGKLLCLSEGYSLAHLVAGEFSCFTVMLRMFCLRSLHMLCFPASQSCCTCVRLLPLSAGQLPKYSVQGFCLEGRRGRQSYAVDILAQAPF